MPGHEPVEEYDIVCVGAGAGGLASAIAAADLGLRAIVLEQAPRIGGNTAWSYGIVWAGDTHLARAEGIQELSGRDAGIPRLSRWRPQRSGSHAQLHRAFARRRSLFRGGRRNSVLHGQESSRPLLPTRTRLGSARPQPAGAAVRSGERRAVERAPGVQSLRPRACDVRRDVGMGRPRRLPPMGPDCGRRPRAARRADVWRRPWWAIFSRRFSPAASRSGCRQRRSA